MLGPKVALIVDDELFARLMALQILLEDDFCVLEASNAAEALDMLERNDDVSLLITDISMPGEMDGLDLARTVRGQRPHVATVLTSGFVRPKENAVPGASFLAKPYTAHALRDIIREVHLASA